MNHPLFAAGGTPLLASAELLDSVAVKGAKRCWTWREVHAESIALAQRLDEGATLCNLCATRLGFLVVWLAGLRRACRQQLPPSGGPAELTALLKLSGRRPLIVADDPSIFPAEWRAQAQCLIYEPGRAASPSTDASLQWSPAWDEPMVSLFTSGSTGHPEPKVKTLRQLATGALVLAQRLQQEVVGGPESLQQIVCSVPPQHMFGLETSVMLPLVSGLSVLDRRPLLPSDVAEAVNGCVDHVLWVATPLHLRALAKSQERLHACRAVLASTMALSTGLAVQSEMLAGAPVLEIYGSTETGVIAMRRTAQTSRWTAVQGVRFESSTPETLVMGEHFPSPQVLADQIEQDAEGGFVLLGRNSDLIKIAGRRASLAGLNLMLQDVEGLSDAVFHLPATEAMDQRLVLIHAGDIPDRAAFESWLRARIDPVFMPRGYIRVECLPRTEAGKLPRAALDRLYAAWSAGGASR